MVNGLQLYQQYRGNEQEMGLRQEAAAREAEGSGLRNQMMRFQFAQAQEQAQRQRQQQNMLAQAVQSGNPNALMMADPKLGFQMQQMRSREQMHRERIAAQNQPRPQQPQWDSGRGVWVTPPQPGVGGVTPGMGGGVVQPQGLPENANDRRAREAEEKEKSRTDRPLEKAGIIINKVGTALSQTSPGTTGLTGDFRRTMLGRVTGSEAFDLGKTLETIRANLGFEELAKMREMSPTGGALGQVAVQELTYLQSALDNLDPGQSEDQLKRNLRAVQTHYDNWRKTVSQARGQPTATGGGAGGTPGGFDMGAIDAELKRREGKR